MPSNPGSYTGIGSISLLFFPKSCNPTPSTSSPPSQYLSTYSLSNTDGPLTETIQDTALAYFTTSGTPSNASTLDALTQQFAVDYTNWKQSQFDYVLVGVAAILPNGLIDTIQIDYLSQKQLCSTRIYTYPYNFQIQRLGHYDYFNDCTTGTPPPYDGAPSLWLYGPPASCSGGHLQLPVYGLMFIDGRLTEKYIRTDSL